MPLKQGINPWVGDAQKGHNEVQHIIFIFLFLEAPLKWDLKLTIGMYLSEGQNDHLNASEKRCSGNTQKVKEKIKNDRPEATLTMLHTIWKCPHWYILPQR